MGNCFDAKKNVSINDGEFPEQKLAQQPVSSPP